MENDSSLEVRLHALLEERSVVGASVAVVRSGHIELASGGLREAAGGVPVDPATVFDAASLTKPLVAYAVLQLADAKVLSLDEPLAEFVRPVVRDDPRATRITARHLLTHTSGLQNIRGKEPLRMYFEPGSWFSYSSLGFMYLQLAVEARTREPLESTLQRLVFGPLNMDSSSLEWREAFAANEAVPHESGESAQRHRAPAANASYSLKTTAGDYAAFLRAVLDGARLKDETWREWLKPAVMVPLREIERLDRKPEETEPGIGWGLGWGVEPAAGAFFQWGKMTGVRAFVMGSLGRKTGLVLLANSNTGMRLANDLIAPLLPGEHPAFPWLRAGVSE